MSTVVVNRGGNGGRAASATRLLPLVQTLSGTAPTFNVASGEVATWTLTGNSTFGVPTNMATGEKCWVYITQDSTPRTVTFSGFTWPASVTPAVSTASGAVDVLEIHRIGSTYYAELAPFTVSPLTPTQVVYADANGLPAGNANLTFDGLKLSLGDTTDASSYTTGTLTSLGGASFAKQVYCRGLVSKRSTNAGATGCVDIGESAGNATKSGPNNVCVGTTVGNNLTTGFDNFLFGTLAGTGLTTGEANIAIGKGALQSGNVSYSIAIGRNALNSGGGIGNVAIGAAAMVFAVGGDVNTAIGYGALLGVAATSNGASNVAIGYNAMLRYTSAANNTCVGSEAGDDLTSGASNIFIGRNAGDGLTTTSHALRIQNNASFAVISGTGINAAAGSQVAFNGTDDSTSGTTGAVIVSGGLGVAKTVGVGDRVNLASVAGTTNAGDMWRDSTQKAVQAYVAGVEQTLPGVLFTGTASTSVGNSTAEATLLPTGVGTKTLPANFLVAGKKVRIRCHGRISSDSSNALTLRLKLGSTTLASFALAWPFAAATDTFVIEAELTCRTTGASGTASAFIRTLVGWAAASDSCVIKSDQGTPTVDTTASAALDVTAQWGSPAAAADNAEIYDCSIEVLN